MATHASDPRAPINAKAEPVSKDNATMSFDRMRSMLVRAAEIRDSEQQQVFDALDEIHARLAPLEAIGSVRKRLSELPDRTEVSVLAERLDETLSRLESQDSAISDLARSVDTIVDRLAKPFAELGGRLDGVAGRFEGVAGRMDGLEDRISSLHQRIDQLEHHLDKQDTRIDGLPSSVSGPVRDRIDGLEGALGDRVDSVLRTVAETSSSLSGNLGDTRSQIAEALDAQSSRLDPTERLEALANRLTQVTDQIEAVSARVQTVEGEVGNRLGELSGKVDSRLSELASTVAHRPDADALASLVRRANEESEVRNAGQLDEAMATFAELIMGGSPTPTMMTAPPPRPAPRRARRPASKGADSNSENGTVDAVAAS